MGDKRKLWVGFHHIKLAITIFLYLPVAKWVMGGSALAAARMCWVIAILLISPYMRFYREVNSKQNQI
jgi:hypothetical protein